jgi:cysteine desulfurase
MKTIYLDHNATSPLLPAAQAVMIDIWNVPLNSSSIHQNGRSARKLMEDARNGILTQLGATNARLIFTASGTEANNLAMHGIENIAILISAVEHHSVLKSANYTGLIPVDANGVVRLEALENLLKIGGKKPLVSVMLANNETGVIQPIKEIVALSKKYGALVHTDAVQAFGKIPVSFDDLGVDMMTVSAHKLGGPVGAAALIVKKPLLVKAQIKGGGQEQSFRAGTENVAAIVGFAAAASARKNQGANDNIRALRDWLEAELEGYTGMSLVFGKDVERLPNTSCLHMPNVANEIQLMHFDMAGIAVSAGSACSSGKVEASHVLLAQNVKSSEALETIRISLGAETTKNELIQFIKSWQQLYQRTHTNHPRIQQATR